jgi:hypothetical protein
MFLSKVGVVAGQFFQYFLQGLTVEQFYVNYLRLFLPFLRNNSFFLKNNVRAIFQPK